MKKESSDQLTLTVSTHNAFGPSQASVLLMALKEHRDFSLRATMSEIKNGDLPEAFLSYSDYQDCVKMLDDLTSDAVGICYENHCARNPNAGHTPEFIRQRKASDYQDFLKEFSLSDPHAE